MTGRPYQGLSDQQLDELTQSLLDQVSEASKEPDKDSLRTDRNEVLAEMAIRQLAGADESTSISGNPPSIIDAEIRIGHDSSPEERAAAAELADNLRAIGRTVVITRYPEGWSAPAGAGGLTVVEEVAIFIGSGVVSSILNSVVTDVYSTAKSWARKRLKENAPSKDIPGSRPRGFLGRLRRGSAPEAQRSPNEVVRIFGPDAKILMYWSLTELGEQENDYRPEE